MLKLVSLVAGAAIALFAGSLAQAAPDRGDSCFRLTDIGATRLDGTSTLYFRVNGHRVFRIEFENPCESATNQTLVMHPVTNNDQICRAIELNIRVRDTGEACVPRSLTELTPDQVAALPPKVRP